MCGLVKLCRCSVWWRSKLRYDVNNNVSSSLELWTFFNILFCKVQMNMMYSIFQEWIYLKINCTESVILMCVHFAYYVCMKVSTKLPYSGSQLLFIIKSVKCVVKLEGYSPLSRMIAFENHWTIGKLSFIWCDNIIGKNKKISLIRYWGKLTSTRAKQDHFRWKYCITPFN